jgi:predicted PurR-regulated permease PerM
LLEVADDPKVEPRVTPSKTNAIHFAAQIATIGIFVLLFGAFLQSARTLLLPIICAFTIGFMLSPLARRAATYHIPSPVFAITATALFFFLIQFALAAVLGPIVAVAAHASEVGDNLRQKFAVFEPLVDYLRSLQARIMPWGPDLLGGANLPTINLTDAVKPVAAFLTPAIGEIVIFLATLLLFLISRDAIRRGTILLFPDSESRLRAIRMFNDVEENLVRYLGTVAAINLGVGALTALGALLLGFPSPVLLGMLAFLCAFIPYIGAAFMTVVLFSVGLVSFPGWFEAIVATAFYVALVTCEGNFITPSIVGLRFTLSPLAVFLSLAFWAWLWGPVGGFLSVPLLIVGVAAVQNLPSRQTVIPQ